ncbi:hypothetical protein PR003_g9672 [Phytophthora rubi]|uniref:Uncharacterized protein n=1 Tax=Phytophthora rubi TaxID=129364 RepID=A0A6A4F7P7_9STRA|nr:hypothetical protein PR002_g9470 [Phytophthora rubi]KAE9034820.1 hypothetical protein PR001_g9576 [Phytophthora rubi]KAE9342066.1 hypothetical protein PR003_g9672 [Phytophthora rubi]
MVPRAVGFDVGAISVVVWSVVMLANTSGDGNLTVTIRQHSETVGEEEQDVEADESAEEEVEESKRQKGDHDSGADDDNEQAGLAMAALFYAYVLFDACVGS